jgi:two-component system chemotaxis response regulator CheY
MADQTFNILIVDDSATTRAIIKRTVQMTGIPTEQIFEASDGLQALLTLGREKIDLILLDLNMPNMGGLETTKRIRSMPCIATVPVVIVSSESTAGRQNQLAAEGVQAYITKPFTPERIREVLTNVLGVKDAA